MELHRALTALLLHPLALTELPLLPQAPTEPLQAHMEPLAADQLHVPASALVALEAGPDSPHPRPMVLPPRLQLSSLLQPHTVLLLRFMELLRSEDTLHPSTAELRMISP